MKQKLKEQIRDKLGTPKIIIHIEITNQTHSYSETKTDPKIYRTVNSLTNKFTKQLKTVLKELEDPTSTKQKK